MTSPTGIIPEELLFREKKAEVIKWLKAVPLEGRQKRALLLGYAQLVGVRLQAREYRDVEETGIDK